MALERRRIGGDQPFERLACGIGADGTRARHQNCGKTKTARELSPFERALALAHQCVHSVDHVGITLGSERMLTGYRERYRGFVVVPAARAPEEIVARQILKQ